jgi:iron complex transport system substrate-binding protein
MRSPSLTRALGRLGLAELLIAGGMTFGLAAAHSHAAEAPRKPQRIVSINMCADELVLRLADPHNIASITWLARNPDNSNVAQAAQDFAINHGLAEEIIPLNPDLVIAGRYTARAALALLKRVGVPAMDVDVPRTFDEVRQQYREVAAILGEQARGERVIAEMDEGLAGLARERPSARLRAIVLNPNGFTVGRGSVVDEIITRAGLENVAATLGLGEYAQIPLEIVAMNAIDILIVSSTRDGPPAMATEVLRHPVLSRLSGRTQVVAMPNRLWNCGGPGLVEAVARLMRAATDFRGKAAGE